ncbi:MAG: thioredoxin domain-containing protein [Acidimicrobiales bacterium]
MPLLRESRDQIGSPYLLQHADNPVNWWSWGPDALAHAVELDRPIFLSVGYASCHWCHVMAHESFEDPDVARLLNQWFVAIKVDREERPDVDAFYMAATQAVSGHGGWPMSVFLTPTALPFMAGTYYPPEDRHGQVGFKRLLLAMHDAWTTQRSVVEQQAIELSRAARREASFVDHLTSDANHFDLAATTMLLAEQLRSQFDEEGGFGRAPKFPRPSFVEALVDAHDARSRDCVQRTLEAMSRGGIYDHLLGGFARYSVDAQWHVPHFEKMLSDQALLARVYLRAARARPDQPQWRDVALDTLRFVVRDLEIDGAFAASLDADADGVEGSHVTWTVDEVRAALAKSHLEQHLDEVLARYRITTPGLFEGRSIPRLAEGEPFVAPDVLGASLEALRAARKARSQPARDDKVILEWNAMFASALFRSSETDLVERGRGLLARLSRTHWREDVWWRTDRRQAFATASDVAWLLDAHLDAYELNGEHAHVLTATALARYLVEHYWDGDVPTAVTPHAGGGLFSQCDLGVDLPVRPKEIFDGATPSAHAVGARALARLSLLSGDETFLFVAERLVEIASPLLVSHPTAVVDLVLAAQYVFDGVQVVVPGAANSLSEHVRSLSMPNLALVTGDGPSPLLEGRRAGLAYVCRRGVCRLPATTVEELGERLAEVRR